MSNSFDKALGAKIRGERRLRGITQMQLAQRLGVSFQQLQKYESGTNKISVERLVELSRFFDVPCHLWLENLPQEAQAPEPAPAQNTQEQRQALALLQAYHAINSERYRALLCSMANALAEKVGAELMLRNV